jgi:DNA mismatch repair ATPase MutS
LGAWEALSSLASLAWDHPDWCDPVFTDGGTVRVAGTALGHPLLAPGECVRNDVVVGPPGTFLLVTGSNMSGKTTLLRAVGANVVLAGAGAPVCAASLSLPHVRVHTSMRVDDSLAQGVSLFMAELLRIRGIVEAADAQGPPVLYLLDEILHGTNTAERRVAARAVIRHLLARDAVGAVSSHDLTLAEAPDLDAAASKVHFREQVERPDGRTKLTFDYRLRPGLATTRNALKLLDAVGLGGLVEEGGEEGETPGDPGERP